MGTKADKSTDKNPSNPEITELKDLYDMMVAEGLDVLELKNDQRHIKLSRQSTPVSYAPRSLNVATPRSPIPSTVPVAPNTGECIQAPLAGVFYRSSSPSNPLFIKEGDTAEPGQTLCIVEAMKVMNEIKAEKRCKIVKIAAENSRPVTVGQPLFWIE